MSARPFTVGPHSAIQAWLEAAAQRKAATPSNEGPLRESIDSATIYTIHDAHPTATLDLIGLDLSDGREGYPSGKSLAIPLEGHA
jgi:hypothetical protein